MCFISCTLPAQNIKTFDVSSADNKIKLHVAIGDNIMWSVTDGNDVVISPSAISLQLQNETLGNHAIVTSSKTEKVNKVISAINYIKASIPDNYSQLVLRCKGDYGLVFRVYNDAVAYRFFTERKDSIIIKNEEANFNFTNDDSAFMPIQWDYRDGQNFNSSFEALYHHITLSQFPKDSLAFLPLLVDVGNGKKAEILEADLEDYPGMYLHPNETQKGLKGVYAPYPAKEYLHGINYVASATRKLYRENRWNKKFSVAYSCHK